MTNDLKSAPRFPLDDYRRFIREASAYVSIVVGRRLRPEDAGLLSDEEIAKIARIIDQRATELVKKNNP